MAQDPRGQTLWEMFLDWMRGRPRDDEESFAAEPPREMVQPPPMPNPLEWQVGQTVQLAPQNGEAFARPVTVRGMRQIVRRIGNQTFSFVDYRLQPPGRDELRLRCVADNGGESRLLIECVDEFAAAPEFFNVVDDETGVFEITNDETGEVDRFERIHGLRGPYHAMARENEELTPVDYWDWVRQAPDGSEEFVFVEFWKQRDRVEIWRGWRLID